MEEIRDALKKLRAYVETERFRGYDPYDALNGSFDFSRFGRWAPILVIQVQKRNPINIRPQLGIEKGINPKALGLLLYAYTQLYELEKSDECLASAYREQAHAIFEQLTEHISKGYSGACWGYNFDWASPVKYLPAYTPSVVVTAFVCKGLFKYYMATQDEGARTLLLSACDFILEDLPRTETREGICFSYTPAMRDCCYNASLLGAEVLARAYALTNNDELLEWAVKASDFVIERQHTDGHWKYSLDVKTGSERDQVDFHQGFVLDSLRDVIRYGGLNAPRVERALARGVAFYKARQFKENGRSLWRLPRKWPVDIHHQAQGIITFSKLNHLDPSYGPFAARIARWTVANMQDRRGYFYYRKGRMWVNKISYMRWAQAWMMVALSQLMTIRNVHL